MVKLVYALRAALTGLRRAPFVHAVAVLTIAVSLFAVGLAYLSVQALSGVLESWGADVEVTLWLQDGTAEEKVAELAEGLRKEHQAEVRLVTPKEALARLQKDLGEAGEVLSDLPRNPLPASLEVRPPTSSRAQLATLAEGWGRLPGVESVEYGREWVERLERIGAASRVAALAILLVILLATVVVVAATLQLAIYARREEIEIQKLVGATNSFVNAPFLLEGLVQGLLGGALASGGVLGLLAWMMPRVGETLGIFAGHSGPLAFVGWQTLASLVAVGGALGLVGSLVAVRRFLRV